MGLRLSLKDLMFFVHELPLPNLVDLMEDYETNSMHYAREELLQARLGRFVRLSNEYTRIQIQYP